MKRLSFCAGLALMCAACTDQQLPLAPTTVAGPAPPVATPPLPTTVPGVLAVGMPIDPFDLAFAAYGIAPFGYHDADHADGGHTGWDIEFRPGGIVRAAAAGTVQSVAPDPSAAGRFTVQIEHIVGTHHYRTVYANLASVSADVMQAEVVRAGQLLGTPGALGALGTLGIHFQLDDFEYYREIPNPNAVSPEPFLTAEAKSLFDRMWSSAHFAFELVEPFATNPRALAFPASRTWTRAGGDGPAGIRFTRRAARGADYEYDLLAESGTVVETGTVQLTITDRPFPAIDLVSPTSRRLGRYDIVSNEMRLALSNPGSARPNDLAAAAVYRSAR